MSKMYLGLLLLLAPLVCSGQRLFNDAHLNHLFQEMEVKGDTLGAVWIYCEAPDYKRVGDDDEGFTCVDDVARALIVYCREYKRQPSQALAKRIQRLADFIIFMSDGNGMWYNFMWKEETINKEHVNSKATPNFWTWRAYWALSELALIDLPLTAEKQKVIDGLCTKTEILIDSILSAQRGELNVFDIKLSKLYDKPGADQLSVMLLALCNRYEKSKRQAQLHKIKIIADNLAMYVLGNEESPPFGAILCWNYYWHAWGASQYYALLNAYKQTRYPLYLEKALEGLDFFYPWLQKNNYPAEMKLTKMEGNYVWTSIDFYPQIAYGFSPMILAATEAATLTGDKKYALLAFESAMWFFGKNKPGKKMYDPETGICFDGVVDSREINSNAGAESTIEALLAMQALEQLNTFGREYNFFLNNINIRTHGLH